MKEHPVIVDRHRPNDRERVRFVVNPNSAGGATGRRLAELRMAVAHHFTQADVVLTERSGHATTLVRQALQDGMQAVFAVGGDGTASEAVNGLLADGVDAQTGVVFGVIPAGTGSDFVRNAGMPDAIDAAVQIAAFGPDNAIDVARITFVDHDGHERVRLGVNVTGFGINGAIVARANASSKRLGGTVTFALATAATVASYRASPVRVTWEERDGTPGAWEGDLLAGFAANGAWCGGGMWVGRGGRIDDGAFELTILPKMSPAKLAWHAPRLYTGTLRDAPGVVGVVARKLTATPLSPSRSAEVPLDIDGEPLGRLPISVSVLPKAIRLRGVWE